MYGLLGNRCEGMKWSRNVEDEEVMPRVLDLRRRILGRSV